MTKFINVPTPVLKIWIGREEAKLEKIQQIITDALQHVGIYQLLRLRF